MQMFFLKNIVSIFIAAFVFTAIAISVMVMKSRASDPADKAPNAMPQKAQITSVNEALSPPPETTAPEENLPPAPDEFDPTQTPSERIVEEWERLGIVPTGEEELFSFSEKHDDAGNQNAPDPQPETAPPPSQQGDGALAIPPEDANAPQDGAPLVKVDVLPVRAKIVMATPHFLQKAALKFDNDEGAPKPKTDPADPTSEGTGPNGKHKGGPKVVSLSAIPIIRMGESFPSQRQEFKVIKPWVS